MRQIKKIATRRILVQRAARSEAVQRVKRRRLRQELMAVLEEDPNARVIQLSKGMFSIVNAGDYARVSSLNWSYLEGYAVRMHTVSYRKRIGLKMHRFILKAPDGIEVDHKNGNGIDNRRRNLRLCTRAENARNVGFKVNQGNLLGIKGVWFYKAKNRYVATVRSNGKLYCRRSKTIDGAVLARKQLLIELHGEFANFEDR